MLAVLLWIHHSMQESYYLFYAGMDMISIVLTYNTIILIKGNPFGRETDFAKQIEKSNSIKYQKLVSKLSATT